MKEFVFDIVLTAALRVKATSEEEARKLLAEHLVCADTNFGAWPNGDPILAETSIRDRPRLYEINGEPYEPAADSDEDFIRRAENDGARFAKSDSGWVAQNAAEQWVVCSDGKNRPQPTLAACARIYCADMDV